MGAGVRKETKVAAAIAGRDVRHSGFRPTGNIAHRPRHTASRLGVTPQAIDDTLYDAFGQRQVATIFTQLNQYHVVLELDPRSQLDSQAASLASSAASTAVPISEIRIGAPFL
jgi:multidrug efflux pump subunit AcrB